MLFYLIGFRFSAYQSISMTQQKRMPLTFASNRFCTELVGEGVADLSELTGGSTASAGDGGALLWGGEAACGLVSTGATVLTAACGFSDVPGVTAPPAYCLTRSRWMLFIQLNMALSSSWNCLYSSTLASKYSRFVNREFWT